MRTSIDLVGLLDRLYGAAQDPSGWPGFLELFADHTTDGMAGLHRYRLDAGEGEAAISVRLDPAWAGRYRDHFCHVNPWMLRDPRLLIPGTFNPATESIGEIEFMASEWYNDFLRPQGYRYSLGAVARREGVEVVTLTTLRSERSGPYGEFERDVYRKVLPHLVRALELESTIRRLEGESLRTHTILDRLPFGVLELDGAGAVRFVNRQAEEILAARDGLTLDRGQFTAFRCSETARIRAAVARARLLARGEVTDPVEPIAVGRPSGSRAYVVAAHPLRSRYRSGGGVSGAVVVFLSDPERGRRLDPRTLRDLFALTEREAVLAAELVAGSDLFDAAARLGMSTETARSHLKRVQGKTDTHRQAELVTLLLHSLPVDSPDSER